MGLGLYIIGGSVRAWAFSFSGVQKKLVSVKRNIFFVMMKLVWLAG